MIKRINILLFAASIALFAYSDDIAPTDSTEQATVEPTRPKIMEAMRENVTIFEDESIDRLLEDKIEGRQREEVQVQGYRVQVFSSNKAQTAKNEAFAVEQLIKDADIDVPIYVLYNPPFWKVRLGNFRSQEEAMLLRDEIIRKFAQLQGDTYVVRDMITVLE